MLALSSLTLGPEPACRQRPFHSLLKKTSFIFSLPVSSQVHIHINRSLIHSTSTIVATNAYKSHQAARSVSLLAILYIRAHVLMRGLVYRETD
jgi:hypothetical protein